MKHLNEFIIEKFKINKDIDIKFNPDSLNNDNTIIFDSESSEGETWEDCTDEIKQINDKYYGFLVCKFIPLSKIKNYEKDINDYSDQLDQITDRILTGRDLGYQIKLVKGHLEYDCINSGSRATYYVYALSEEAYLAVEEWFNGDLETSELKSLFNEESILEITL